MSPAVYQLTAPHLSAAQDISESTGVNGIVPMDALERDYRERTGRLQIRIAEKAERVERIVCGISQRLK